MITHHLFTKNASPWIKRTFHTTKPFMRTKGCSLLLTWCPDVWILWSGQLLKLIGFPRSQRVECRHWLGNSLKATINSKCLNNWPVPLRTFIVIKFCTSPFVVFLYVTTISGTHATGFAASPPLPHNFARFPLSYFRSLCLRSRFDGEFVTPRIHLS